MAISDPLGDMLTRIRNSLLRGHKTVMTPASKLRKHVLDVLVEEGFVKSYIEVQEDSFSAFEINLKYYNGESVISNIKRISKPGRRVYKSVKNLPHVRNGLGISILSTSKGVMSDAVARKNNVGGEVLCQIS